MNDAGLIRRVLASAARTALAAFAVITGLFTNPAKPAVPPAANSQPSTHPRLPDQPQSVSDAHAIPFQHRTR